MIRVYHRWRVGILCLWGASALTVLAALVLMVTRASA